MPSFDIHSQFLAREAIGGTVEFFIAERRGGESDLILGNGTRQAIKKVTIGGRGLQTGRCNEADDCQCSEELHWPRCVATGYTFVFVYCIELAPQ